MLLHTFIDENVEEIQQWLNTNAGQQLKEVGRYAGGAKCLEQDIWAGAINFLDIDGFIAAVKACKWERPEAVQLFICTQEENRFKEVLPVRSD